MDGGLAEIISFKCPLLTDGTSTFLIRFFVTDMVFVLNVLRKFHVVLCNSDVMKTVFLRDEDVTEIVKNWRNNVVIQ